MIWGALAGGFVGTIVLTGGLRLAQEVGWTRMDIPLLLGTMFTARRSRAAAIGYGFHFFNGLVFSLLYGLVFIAVDRAGWELGLALGLAHATFAGGGLVNVLLPAVHPRMGTPWSSSRERADPRAARLHAQELRPSDRHRHDPAAPRLRSDRRRVRRGTLAWRASFPYDIHGPGTYCASPRTGGVYSAAAKTQAKLGGAV